MRKVTAWESTKPSASQITEHKRLIQLAKENDQPFLAEVYSIDNFDNATNVMRKIEQLKVRLIASGVDVKNYNTNFITCASCMLYKPTVGSAGICNREHAPTKCGAGCYAGKIRNE